MPFQKEARIDDLLFDSLLVTHTSVETIVLNTPRGGRPELPFTENGRGLEGKGRNNRIDVDVRRSRISEHAARHEVHSGPILVVTKS